jgi:hypothetical protein
MGMGLAERRRSSVQNSSFDAALWSVVGDLKPMILLVGFDIETISVVIGCD